VHGVLTAMKMQAMLLSFSDATHANPLSRLRERVAEGRERERLVTHGMVSIGCPSPPPLSPQAGRGESYLSLEAGKDDAHP